MIRRATLSGNSDLGLLHDYVEQVGHSIFQSYKPTLILVTKNIDLVSNRIQFLVSGANVLHSYHKAQQPVDQRELEVAIGSHRCIQVGKGRTARFVLSGES